MSDRLWMSLAVTVVMLGCASPGAGSATITAAEPAAISGPPRPWAELSHQERAQHMSREVMPRMSALFAGYDGERYADFDCATCHGPDARERSFAMPNPSILPLHATGTEGQRQAVHDYPEGVRFMYSSVLPTMQALLGAAPFDETTGEGFTCYACHTHADVPTGVLAPEVAYGSARSARTEETGVGEPILGQP